LSEGRKQRRISGSGRRFRSRGLEGRWRGMRIAWGVVVRERKIGCGGGVMRLLEGCIMEPYACNRGVMRLMDSWGNEKFGWKTWR